MTKKQGILLLLACCVLITLCATACTANAPTAAPGQAFAPANPTLTPFLPQSPTPKNTLLPAQPPAPSSGTETLAILTPAAPLTASPTAITLSNAALSPTPLACLQEGGRVEEKEIEFHPGEMAYAFRIYLPPCFDVQENPNYPVLVMIHGQTFADDQWDRLGIDEAADTLVSEGKARPFIIVMPRERDTYGDIYASPFAKGLIQDLLPWIDANYPTCTERSCRAIGGLSRGGAWALRLGMENWQLFGAIGMHSTPPFIGDRESYLPRWLAAIPADQLPRIFMDTGSSDWYLVPTTRLEETLTSVSVPHEWYLFNGTHEEAYWSAHVRDYLEWYTRPWQP